MSNWSDAELNNLVESVVRRAAVDAEFRSLAVSDPAAALGKFADKPINGLKIRFVDMQGPEKTIVLPAPVYKVGELTAQELEAVAGGIDDDDDDDCMYTCICSGGCCYTCTITGAEA